MVVMVMMMMMMMMMTIKRPELRRLLTRVL